jgi:hypothetical protein
VVAVLVVSQFVFFELSTPKALANSSPGLLQPWGKRRMILRTLKEFLRAHA